jgi:pimeloyl-ACP methyl ester carboxylesterase
MYKEKRSAQSEFVPIRGLQYHMQHWSPRAAACAQPPLVLLHGWMDVAASFQFVVDALSEAFASQRRIIAPDWRGFGQTSGGPVDCFWFPDYLADLDALLDHVSADLPVDLVGHSMGGNVAMMYAGVRPERVRRLVNVEGFGLAASRPSQAPGRYARWLDELKNARQGQGALKSYDSAAGVAERLIKTNPRLALDKAIWLAERWAQPDAKGRWHIRGHAAHKMSNPQLYRVDEMLEVFARISAPVLSVEADHNALAAWWKGAYTLDDYHERIKNIPDVRTATVSEAGHMLHHDQPEQLASLIEAFIADATRQTLNPQKLSRSGTLEPF